MNAENDTVALTMHKVRELYMDLVDEFETEFRSGKNRLLVRSARELPTRVRVEVTHEPERADRSR
jgi:hypothetical protein